MAKSFVHLHVHSEYSLLDGLLKIDDLIKKAAGSGMPAVALTDHGNMYGVIDFYKRAKAAGIKPIIGCEVYQAPKSRFIKKIDKESNEELYNHLTLIVKNNRGYKNLMKLVSLGFLEGFYYKPRIDAELLGKYSEGLIALSGCLSGKIPRFIESGKLDQAEKAIQDYIDIFGKDNFYLELTDFGLKKQKEINRIMYELSKKHSIPVVATNDIHYLNREDFKYHFILLCIQAGATIGDFNNIYPEQDSGFDLGEKIKRIITSLAEREEQNRLDDEKSGFFPRTMEYYFKEAQEMERIFSDFPGALETTSEIASRCDVNIEFDLGLIPPFKVPEPYVPDSYLEFLCLEGAKQKYGDLNAEVEERLKKELQVIKKWALQNIFS